MKHHETLAALLFSGAVAFASASFAAGVGAGIDATGKVNVPPPPNIDAPSVPAAPGASRLPVPPTPTIPDVTAPAPPPGASNENKDTEAPATQSEEKPEGITPNTAEAPAAEPATRIAGLGERSTDTSKMSRRQADRTEQKITQELNRASASGTGNANATTQASEPAGSNPASGTP
jgi:hypothetical protein